MERVNRILQSRTWKYHIEGLNEAEKDRVFCRHSTEHLLDTARIAWIFNLEEDLGIDKGMIYAAALLHDIGRYRQYTEGIDHDIAGASLAEEILAECGYEEAEIAMIVSAISEHRAQTASGSVLSKLLYRADKSSRMCMFCSSEKDCYWDKNKKNMVLSV